MFEYKYHYITRLVQTKDKYSLDYSWMDHFVLVIVRHMSRRLWYKGKPRIMFPSVVFSQKQLPSLIVYFF